MGIDTSAAIFVGRPREDFEDGEQLQAWIDADEIHVCPPHYDGNHADWAICGYGLHRSTDYSATELNFNEAHAEQLKAKFKALTGMDAKVWLSPHVS